MSTIDSVCHAPPNCFFFFLFLDGIEPFFGRHFSMCSSTKHCSSIFDLGPLTPKIYSPKICTKSLITRLVWQIDQRCLGLPGVSGNGRFNGTMQNVVRPTLVEMATKFGLGAEIQSPTGLYSMTLCFSLTTKKTFSNLSRFDLVKSNSFRSFSSSASSPNFSVFHEETN